MRTGLLALVAVMVVGCSTGAAGTGTPTAAVGTPTAAVGTPTAAVGTPTAAVGTPTTAPEPSPTGKAPVSVVGDPDTGASAVFELADGSYEVAWTTTADTAGCYFSLILAPEVNGPSVKNDVKLLPEARSYSGTFLWLFVQAGTYVLQEDRSGYGHCKGPWSATITMK